jgi:hypothetical protein
MRGTLQGAHPCRMLRMAPTLRSLRCRPAMVSAHPQGCTTATQCSVIDAFVVRAALGFQCCCPSLDWYNHSPEKAFCYRCFTAPGASGSSTAASSNRLLTGGSAASTANGHHHSGSGVQQNGMSGGALSAAGGQQLTASQQATQAAISNTAARADGLVPVRTGLAWAALGERTNIASPLVCSPMWDLRSHILGEIFCCRAAQDNKWPRHGSCPNE